MRPLCQSLSAPLPYRFSLQSLLVLPRLVFPKQHLHSARKNRVVPLGSRSQGAGVSSSSAGCKSSVAGADYRKAAWARPKLGFATRRERKSDGGSDHRVKSKAPPLSPFPQPSFPLTFAAASRTINRRTKSEYGRPSERRDQRNIWLCVIRQNTGITGFTSLR